MTTPQTTREQIATGIALLRAAGVPAGEIADHAGLSRRRVHQALHRGPTKIELDLHAIQEAVRELTEDIAARGRT